MTVDISCLDALAKVLAARGSRRATVQASIAGLAAAVLGVPGLGRAAAKGAAPAGTPAVDGREDPVFLFVQTFASGSFRRNPGAGTPAAAGTPPPGGGAAYLLTLEGHHGETVYFSDRPDRIFGEAPTEDFLAGMGFSPANPPNAALVAQTDVADDVVVLELVTPTYDAAAGTLTYGAEILAEYRGEGLAHVAAQRQDEALPETFGRASLFIDDCPDITDCIRPCYGETIFRSAGPIPGGPYGACWNWDEFNCIPCRDYGDLEALCYTAYDACRNYGPPCKVG